MKALARQGLYDKTYARQVAARTGVGGVGRTAETLHRNAHALGAFPLPASIEELHYGTDRRSDRGQVERLASRSFIDKAEP